jgi:carboxymethylenebutenolidase
MARARPVLSVLLFAVANGSSCVGAAEGGPTGSSGSTVGATTPTPSAPDLSEKEVVSFESGDVTLQGVVYKPRERGAFPAVLWNHGSWGDPMVAFDQLAPAFTARGWILFGPFRRGQGLSASAGAYIGDELDRAGKRGGMKARATEMVRLLTGDHLADQLAAYAWLKKQPFVVAERIAVAGNSFGGIEVVLGAEQVPYCAAIDGAGGAQSWALAPELKDVMIRAARASRAPMFFFQAENDFDLSPSQTLAAAMREVGKTAEVRIYPPFGDNRGDGHNFAWRGSAIWAQEVFAFLGRHCDGQ